MQPSSVEKHHFYNNLVCLAKALTGKYIVIDLRNDATVTGKIDHVDGYMNVEMKDVLFYNPRGYEYKFDSFFINARNIRYIHIPEGMSALQLIENELLNTKIPHSRQTRTFKTKRAEEYHQETVANLSNKTE